MTQLRWPLSVQITLPDDFTSNVTTRNELDQLNQLGFFGVEVNFRDPSTIPYEELERFVRSFGLELTSFASGLTAKTFGLSLSHPDEDVREKSTTKLLECIDFVSSVADRSNSEAPAGGTGRTNSKVAGGGTGRSGKAGIIVGFFKGQAGYPEEEAKRQFIRSLDSLVPRAEEKQVPILIEATNRYESSVARSLEETISFIEGYGSQYIRLLPDTFHMNIEEADMFAALRQALPFYNSVHLSDNNRLLPGFGAIDFKRIIEHLRAIGFEGGLAFEGQIKNDLISDCKQSMEYLKPLLGE